ncbi:MAG: SDR family oxidoreductase [Burkholderiaceae bacterium]|nr:SDR family oxidoreductase [Burkholderiaceae bacterium]MDP1968168.1 SDR family oxidoreductase [Burkholderiaceae bacterium]
MSTPIGKLFDLSGKTALVTGGSRGLGLQIAQALGESGARVMLISRKAAELEATTGTLRAQGMDAHCMAADASQPAEITRVAEETMRAFGQIDILVNNAGANWTAPAEDHPLEAWNKVMNLNVTSIFLMCQAVARLSMIPRRSGSIINISSLAGLLGATESKFIAYGTSKGAIVNFTRTLAAEWGQYNINVNALAPGPFPTKMTQGMIDRLGEEHMAAKVPLRRIGDDNALKGAAVLFASEAGRHITGQTLAVDGGISAVHV